MVGWVVVAPADASVDVGVGLEVAAAGAESAVLSGFFWVRMKYPAAARVPTQMRTRMVISGSGVFWASILRGRPAPME